MRLTVNGKETNLEHEMSIAEFLRSKGVAETSVAVERNRRWLRREDWPAAILKENDRLEVIRIMAGG